MTAKQLNDLGFDISALNKVWHGETETEFYVKDIKKIKPSEFITRFYNHAFDAGVTWGKMQKTSEIKKALNIN